MRSKFPGYGLAGALLCTLAGCQGTGARPDSDFFASAWQDAARGIAAGRAYDRALLAADNGNEKRVVESYRRMLPYASKTISDDPDTLNAIGYTLADKGETPEDFLAAEELTRRAVELIEKRVAEISKNPEANQKMLNLMRYAAAAGARDSHAWALFKLKRYDEALKEQERAVADTKANEPALLPSSSGALPDLLYHRGSIYAALGQKEKARADFDEALQRQPGHAEAKAARAKL